MSRGSRRKTSAASRREVQVAAAVAREAVLELHAERALVLIRHAAGRVGELRMLEIYVRLLELGPPAAEAVANRVLAALGRSRSMNSGRAADVPRPAVHEGAGEAGEATEARDAGSADDAPAEDRSVFRLLRRRLRGRVHDELRRTVELQTGVARVALLDTHARHAHTFVKLLAETHDIAGACDIYAEMVEVPRPLAGVLYIMVLDRIAAEETTWPAARSAGDPLPGDTRLPSRPGPRSHRTRSSA